MRPSVLSAGIVPVFISEAPEFLLLRAYRYWDFPKGVVGVKENPLKAAKRELKEETGIAAIDLEWGDRFIETEPYSNNKVARYYMARVLEKKVRLPKSFELGRPEHMEFRWLKAEDARKLLVPRVQKVLDWAALVLQLHN